MAEGRVCFLPNLPVDLFLTLNQLADVVLEPFPFGGGVTSLEIFSVGTPIITFPAYSFGREHPPRCSHRSSRSFRSLLRGSALATPLDALTGSLSSIHRRLNLRS